ncbi:MAG: MFS transporter [Rhizobiaceae bacterium]
MSTNTNWRAVFILFLVGATAALLLAKAAVALPVLQLEFDLSLFQAGLLVSIFSLVAALSAALIGAVADRYGQRRIAVLGLLITALASTVGAFATTTNILLASRICEGLGFFLVSAAIPPLILQQTATRDRQKAMGLWGAFVPAGGSTILLIGGVIIDRFGWQGLWLFTSAALLVATGALLLAIQKQPAASTDVKRAPLSSAYRLLLLPGPMVMALIFMGYSAQYMSLTAYLPLIMVQTFGWSIAAAGLAGGLVFACNMFGNMMSGVLLDRGYSRQAVILIGATAMGLGGIGLFSDLLPVAGRLASATLFSALCGLIPGALFSGAERHVPDRSRLSSINGLLLQGAAVGQLMGPPIAALCVGNTGDWTRILWFSVTTAILVALLGVMLGRQEKAG